MTDHHHCLTNFMCICTGGGGGKSEPVAKGITGTTAIVTGAFSSQIATQLKGFATQWENDLQSVYIRLVGVANHFLT